TNENYDQYQDYTIYVCEFKRKSKKLITKIWKSKKDIQYLNDICRRIDKEYLVNRRRHRKELRKQFSFKTRISIGIYQYLKKCYFIIKNFTTLYAAKCRQYAKVKNNNLKVLQYLKASKLFLFVLFAPINENIRCDLLETEMHLFKNDALVGCCSIEFAFGNLLWDGDLDEIYNGTYARIIKLSSLNQSYCLCNFTRQCTRCVSKKEEISTKLLKSSRIPKSIAISLDGTCNLCCKSCRNKPYVMSDFDRKKINILTAKLIKSGYLDQTQSLIVAGYGEVFYSPHYRRLLETNLKRKSINILSNGTLFNEDNWNWLKDKYETINVMISVDAATKETYSKLRRGGNFEVLMKNLNMLASLHRQGLIGRFSLHFVVQQDNFREMPDFVKLGKSLGVDHIEFQKMVNFGNLSKKEFLEKCLVNENEYLDYEFWQVLQDPIFKDPIVGLDGFGRDIQMSNLRYGKVESK
ncbi:MAG: radical SAM protein, partial [Clostridia bacterium]|nr:radical SAM protein [Clostridia bacterium]